MTEDLFYAFSFFVLGSLCATFIFFLYHMSKVRSYQKIGQEIVAKAESEALACKAAAVEEFETEKTKAQEEIQKEFKDKNLQLKRREQGLIEGQKTLEERIQKCKNKEAFLKKKTSDVETKENALKVAEDLFLEKEKKLLKDCEVLSNSSAKEIKALFIKRIEEAAKKDASKAIEKIQENCKKHAYERSREILLKALQKAQIEELQTNSFIHVGDQAQKARIIGKEGRNIRAFEAKAAVKLIIDESSEISISSPHPIKREIAKSALKNLLKEEKIHARNIDEHVQSAAKDFNDILTKKGLEAAKDLQILDLHPEIQRLLGKLSLHQYQGRNLLEESVAGAHVMNALALELQLNAEISKRIGLLHKIGLASGEVELGSSAIAGHSLALKYGESIYVANGIGVQDQKMPPLTMEAALCPIVLGSAKKEQLKLGKHMQRIKALEDLCCEFPEVEQAYALELEHSFYILLMNPNSSVENSDLFLHELHHKMQSFIHSEKELQIFLSHTNAFVQQHY